MPFVSLEGADPEVLALVAASKADLEARGMSLEQNILTWPRLPAHGWLVKTQNETVLCDENGVFSLTVPENSGPTLTLIHPSIDPEARMGAVPIEVALADFGTDANQPTTMLVPFGFEGPCGMSEDDTDQLCGPPVVATRAQDEISGQYSPPDWERPDQPKPDTFGVIRRPLGTYPPPFRFIVGGCPDTNGVASLVIKDPKKPIGTTPDFLSLVAYLSGRSKGELITYVGSTCDLNVLDGSCANENALTDIEYAKARPALEALAATLGQKLSPPAQRPPEWGSMPCKENHKSRLCGMFYKGDVALEVDGTIVKPGQSHSLRVERGQTGSFTVHNNGVYGFTDIRIGNASAAELVTFSGAPMSRLNLNTHRLRHYDRASGVPYVTDRLLNFRISQLAEEGDEIPVTFTVDQNKVTLLFKVGPGLDVAPSFVNLRSGELQRFEALSGSEPDPPGRTFEWSLANASGTLSSQTGKSINFRAAVIEDEVVFDTLTVRMFDVDASGVRQETDSATAAIRVSRGPDIQLDPPVGVVDPATQGASVRFRVVGPALEELSALSDVEYVWSLTGTAGGSLSNGQRQATTQEPFIDYKPAEDAKDGASETLTVNVYFTPENEQRTLYGLASSQVLITDLTITPTQATLEPGDLQDFTAQVSVAPGSSLEFDWVSLGGKGTLSPTTGPSVQYTADANITQDTTDTVEVTVHVTSADGERRLHGKAIATVTIDADEGPLLVNGDFSNGTAGWSPLPGTNTPTSPSGPYPWFLSTTVVSAPPNNGEGAPFARVDVPFSPGGFSQTVTLPADGSYTLTYLAVGQYDLVSVNTRIVSDGQTLTEETFTPEPTIADVRTTPWTLTGANWSSRSLTFTGEEGASVSVEVRVTNISGGINGTIAVFDNFALSKN
jgi:hypothetical protein